MFNLIPSIDRYILRLTVVPMLGVFALAASLLMLDKMLRLFDFVAVEGGPVAVVFKMLGALIPEYASLAIPLGLLLGVAGKAAAYAARDIATLQLVGDATWQVIHRARQDKLLQEKQDEMDYFFASDLDLFSLVDAKGAAAMDPPQLDKLPLMRRDCVRSRSTRRRRSAPWSARSPYRSCRTCFSPATPRNPRRWWCPRPRQG